MPIGHATEPNDTRKSNATNLLATLTITLFYLSIYIKDWASQWTSSTTSTLLLAAGVLSGILSLITNSRATKDLNQDHWLIILMFGSFWLLTLIFKGAPNMSNYYIAIPCALIITTTNLERFKSILFAHLVLTLIIAGAEYFSGSYLFVYQADDGTELDESLFGGGLDVFRAKGMFQGPLSAVAFALWIAFMMPRSMPAAIILLFCAFFASGRLGMLTATVLIIYRFSTKNSAPLIARLLLATAIAGVTSALLIFSDENRVTFIASALDIENDQNVSRLYFWLTSINHYLSYGPIELIFGDHGYIQRKEGGTENDFLRILLDCGIIGLTLYAFAISSLIRRSIKQKDKEGLLVAILIIVLMNIFPFIQSLSSTLLFWVYFFSTRHTRHNHQTRETRTKH